MIPFPTAQEIADEVRMRCRDYRGPFLLVEGGSDVRFFSCNMAIGTENIIPAFGWERLADALAILQSEGLERILGVVDLDYRGIIDYPELPRNIVITDGHDIETMMLISPAFPKVIRTKSSTEKIRSYPGGIQGVKNKILELGKPIGSLRFYSHLGRKNYAFNKINFDKFISRQSLLFLPDKFVSHIQGIHDNNISITDAVLSDAIAEASRVAIFADCFRLCCGHDLMEILAIGLRSVWGSHYSTEMSRGALEQAFILAYSREMFHQSGLFQRMDSWFHDHAFDTVWSE